MRFDQHLILLEVLGSCCGVGPVIMDVCTLMIYIPRIQSDGDLILAFYLNSLISLRLPSFVLKIPETEDQRLPSRNNLPHFGKLLPRLLSSLLP